MSDKIMKAIIGLLLAAALGLAWITVNAQDKPAPKPDALQLSAGELKAGDEADAVLKGAVDALNAALLASGDVKTDAEAQALGWKVSALFRRVKDAQAGFNEWFEGVRAAHGCKDCTLGEGGKLVRPPTKDEKK